MVYTYGNNTKLGTNIRIYLLKSEAQLGHDHAYKRWASVEVVTSSRKG